MSAQLSPLRRMRSFALGLGRDTSALAMLEFALSLPVVLTMSLTGAELCNYITTRMRVSQLALHIADNASRIGAGGQLQIKTITEGDIQDLFAGAEYQSEELDLRKNGRVILSSLEPVANPNPNPKKFKIRWQRCYGLKSYTAKYGNTNDIKAGMGDPGRLVTVPDGGQTMFVELYYKYTPLVNFELLPETNIVEHASMMVRDTRDTTVGTIGISPLGLKASC